MMKILLTLFVLFFSSSVFADDISDFQIEGMSIGDSLLDYMTVDEIKQNTLPYFPDKRKYYIVGMFDNLKNFDQVEIYLKSKDKNYEIRTLLAALKNYNLNIHLWILILLKFESSLHKISLLDPKMLINYN